MALTKLYKTPFPYFGGKAEAARAVWEALGDCDHYVEPFAGSLAVLLRRPHPCNRPYHSETVCDADGLLCNAWRSIQLSPDATADAASQPVSEADLHARHLALVRWRDEHQLEHLMGDPLWHDPVMGGWWIWGASCWIGGGWCSGAGPWIVGHDGRITRRTSDEPGIKRQLPQLTVAGRGVNRPGAREPGVSRKRPHLADDVNRPGTREPGVSRTRPHLDTAGRGVTHAGAREPGVSRKLPHLADGGQGVNHAGAREPGVSRKLPHLADDGRGVTHAGAREPGVAPPDPQPEPEFHPMTMPEVRRWLRFLAARLRHVRILHGDWSRAVTSGASIILSVRQGGTCGVFLDPPYADTAGRSDELYAMDSSTVAHAVREWALEHGDDPRYRIVLAGYEGEHDMPPAWRTVEWYSAGFLRGGMANQGASGTHQHRERLWLSPHCLAPPAQLGLSFGDQAIAPAEVAE